MPVHSEGWQSAEPGWTKPVFMGAVEKLGEKAANPWIITLQLNGKPVDFCNDTGAEVTVIPEQTHENVGCPPLLRAD